MYQSSNKPDLIFEVWEKLDCESVGAAEILVIEAAVAERFGKAAVDSPMTLARMLADEGAVLRHSEIMELFIARNEAVENEAQLRNILDVSSFAKTLSSLRNITNLRKKLTADNDKDGLRQLRQKVVGERDRLKNDPLRTEKAIAEEIAEWLTIWLQSPDLFENWVALRRASSAFIERYGEQE